MLLLDRDLLLLNWNLLKEGFDLISWKWVSSRILPDAAAGIVQDAPLVVVVAGTEAAVAGTAAAGDIPRYARPEVVAGHGLVVVAGGEMKS